MSNILLLDRNIDEAERISSYFEARSYAVIWPKTIADLLYHVVHRDFCLAILDVALSAEDDHRFLDALRKVKGVPILVLGSDTADAEERLNSLRAGAHAYLCRPYSMEECFAQAQALIQAYSPHMQTRKEENSSCAYRFHPLDDFTLLFQLILPLLFPQQIQLKQAEAVKSFLLFGVTISRDPILVGLGIERAFVPEKVILSEIHKHRLLPACAFIIGA